jgi:uncharacterized protein (TIGR02271 family)
MAEDPISEERIPLVEEMLSIDKRVVETGRVRVRTLVDEVQEVLRGSVGRDKLEFERVAIDQPVETAPPIREENGVLIVPMVEERLVAVKQLFLVEEVRIHRRRSIEPVELAATRRVMRAEIERLDPSETDQPDPTART